MLNISQILKNNSPLIIADLANNHNGDFDLAHQMINELSEIQKKYGFKIVPKFQYRNLDTYIHVDSKKNTNNKYVNRFETTRLEFHDFYELTKIAKSLGLFTAATAFDEYSAIKVKEHGHSILKVASACANDWNLLEACVSQNLPMIVSLGGLSDYQIERVVSFLKHRKADFALMHCVALYPTSDSALNIGRIRFLREKFRVPTGYSTHENPRNTIAGGLALAAGAEILERHYAKGTKDVNVNEYSSEKNVFENWLINLKTALNQINDDKFSDNLEFQRVTLLKLQRGIFAKRFINKSEVIDNSNTYGAFPVGNNQLITNDLTIRSNLVAIEDISLDQPILSTKVSQIDRFGLQEKILSRTRELLALAGVNLGANIDVEISHHFGIECFDSTGAILITLINREYAKKLVVMTKNQSHPEHFHKLKEETFLLLTGKLEVILENKNKILMPGDVLVIPRSYKHSMYALEDSVFEEISSTNFSEDSYYTDNDKLEKNRKTSISLWF